MTTATHTELMQIATKAAAYITKLNGESETFEIEGDTLTAVIEYTAEIGEDNGDRYTAPSWWVEWQDIYVNGVYDEDGENDEEAVEYLTTTLKQLLNIKQ